MNHPIHSRMRALAVLVAILFLLFVGMETIAEARAGGGRSSGSRGFSSGSSSSGGYRSTAPSGTYNRPTTSYPQAAPAPRSSFGRTFMAGLGGGLVGGMLGSMFFRGPGYGYGGGYGGGWGGGYGGGGLGILFDLIFLAIIVAIIYFVVRRFRARRNAMEYSSAGAPYGTYVPGYDAPPDPYYAPPPPPIQNTVADGLRFIRDMDPTFDEARFLDTVQDYFFKIQGAWTRRDLGPVKYLLTPQMLNTFQDDLSRYIQNKQINRLENIAGTAGGYRRRGAGSG